MKRIIVAILLCVSYMGAYAQDQAETVDPKANAILQALSKKTKAFKTIKATFNIIIRDAAGKTTDNQKGTLTVKGGKYKLELKNQTVISDSTTMWTYLKDANEVQINNVDHSADNKNISPTNIFTLYEKGFKTQFVDEETQNGATVEVINLFPKHPEKEKYHTIKLTIDKTKNQIASVKVMMKDGTSVEYTIDTFSSDAAVPDTTFTFNPKDYPGIDVEDLRE